MFHDRERLSGLASMRRPQTAGELMQFLQAVYWLWTSFPRLAEVRGNSTPGQASRVESGDRVGNMEARADACVEQCTRAVGQRSLSVALEKLI